MLQKLLAHPLVRHTNLDDPSTTGLQKQVLQSKPFLKQLYQEWYQLLAAEFSSGQQVLEIGAGPGFLQEHMHNSIRSDVLPVPDSDLVLDARNIPLKDNSLDGIVMTDVLHHVQDCSAFFTEATRVVRPGGKLAMIEPWNNPWARFIYSHLHHETFLPEADDWKLADGGPLSTANGALPWIILVRDRKRFA